MGDLLGSDLLVRPPFRENVLKPVVVGELLQQEDGQPRYKFFIPSYQRGYRWDETQVTDLLDDLYEFTTIKQNAEQKYCLQPVVVKRMEDGRCEVLDGQQRLTTILILLSRLKSKNDEIELFSIEYETRPGSAAFLRSAITGINTDNPDYYYISSAYLTIDNWLEKAKRGKANIGSCLFNTLAESVEFIWYEVRNDYNAIDIFTRINVGKIPLTNSELVKAVFLSKNNLSIGFASGETTDKDFGKILSLKQNAIALEWYNIEKALQDPKFWGFIYNGSENLETRIDYLLDLISRKSPQEKNKYFSFNYFYKKVQEARNNKPLQQELLKGNTSLIENEWNNLKTIFDILQEWYHDKTFNHLIGFLIHYNARVVDLVEEFTKQNRDRFSGVIKAKIKATLNCTNVSELRYDNSDSHKDRLGKVLLFHNVVKSLETKDDNNLYFPYEKIKNKLWTLEHIFAQNSDELREEHYRDWLFDHVGFFRAIPDDLKAAEIVECIQKLLSASGKKIEREEFEECFSKVESYIQTKVSAIDNAMRASVGAETANTENKAEEENEYKWINDDHSIANLALLDGSMNSALQNSLFEIKRRLILQKDKEGLYVPNETKKVFLKYYTDGPRHLAYWTYEDRKAYVKSIKSTLSFLD